MTRSYLMTFLAAWGCPAFDEVFQTILKLQNELTDKFTANKGNEWTNSNTSSRNSLTLPQCWFWDQLLNPWRRTRRSPMIPSYRSAPQTDRIWSNRLEFTKTSGRENSMKNPATKKCVEEPKQHISKGSILQKQQTGRGKGSSNSCSLAWHCGMLVYIDKIFSILYMAGLVVTPPWFLCNCGIWWPMQRSSNDCTSKCDLRRPHWARGILPRLCTGTDGRVVGSAAGLL